MRRGSSLTASCEPCSSRLGLSDSCTKPLEPTRVGAGVPISPRSSRWSSLPSRIASCYVLLVLLDGVTKDDGYDLDNTTWTFHMPTWENNTILFVHGHSSTLQSASPRHHDHADAGSAGDGAGDGAAAGIAPAGAGMTATAGSTGTVLVSTAGGSSTSMSMIGSGASASP